VSSSIDVLFQQNKEYVKMPTTTHIIINATKPYLFFQKYNQKEVHEKVYNTCAWKGEML